MGRGRDASKKTKVPDEIQFKTKPQIALDLVDRAKANGIEVIAWDADELYGRDGHFLDGLDERNEAYVVEIPPNAHAWMLKPKVPRKPSQDWLVLTRKRVAGFDPQTDTMQSRFGELRRYFEGWVGYFHYGLGKQQLQRLDKWTRRRIRACYWKQWYRVRTRIRMLLKLGVRRDEAFSHGSSGRGVWVMSSSAAMHVAISIDYLNQQGLASLETIWHTFASKKRTAVCGPARTVV